MRPYHTGIIILNLETGFMRSPHKRCLHKPCFKVQDDYTSVIRAHVWLPRVTTAEIPYLLFVTIVMGGITECGGIPSIWHLEFLKFNNSQSYRVGSRQQSILNSPRRGAFLGIRAIVVGFPVRRQRPFENGLWFLEEENPSNPRATTSDERERARARGLRWIYYYSSDLCEYESYIGCPYIYI